MCVISSVPLFLIILKETKAKNVQISEPFWCKIVGSFPHLLARSFVICLTAAVQVLRSTRTSFPADSASPCSYKAVLMNLSVSSDGAHPPVRCGSFHEARGAGWPVSQRL